MYLPALRIFPVQIKAIKVVLFDELYDVGNELCSRCGIVHQTTVFVTGRVIPTTDCNGDFDAAIPECCNLGIELC